MCGPVGIKRCPLDEKGPPRAVQEERDLSSRSKSPLEIIQIGWTKENGSHGRTDARSCFLFGKKYNFLHDLSEERKAIAKFRNGRARKSSERVSYVLRALLFYFD